MELHKISYTLELYKKPPISSQERCEAEMRRAVKRAKYIDPQGRKDVKIYGSLPLFDEAGNKTYTQIEMTRARPEQAKAILDDELNGMGNDARSHNTQWESYNDNNWFGATLEKYDYNLNAFIENTDGSYDDSYNEDDFNDDE